VDVIRLADMKSLVVVITRLGTSEGARSLSRLGLHALESIDEAQSVGLGQSTPVIQSVISSGRQRDRNTRHSFLTIGFLHLLVVLLAASTLSAASVAGRARALLICESTSSAEART
jgi:hypothetical protein